MVLKLIKFIGGVMGGAVVTAVALTALYSFLTGVLGWPEPPAALATGSAGVLAMLGVLFFGMEKA